LTSAGPGDPARNRARPRATTRDGASSRDHRNASQLGRSLAHIPHCASFVGTEIVDGPWAYVVSDSCARHLDLHGLALDTLAFDVLAEIEVARIAATSDDGARKILET